MYNVSEAVIKNIIKLGKGSDTQQWTATQKMCDNVFPGGICIDASVIPQILPTIIKFMNCKAPRVQKEGLFFATVVTTTSSATRTQEQHTKLVIDGGALPILAKLLSSKDVGVQEMALKCLGNIAYDYPDRVLMHLNTSRNVILKLVESNNRAVCEQALNMLTNTVISSDEFLCQEILDLGFLKSVKKAVSRIPSIKLLAIKFIKKVSKCEDHIDTIIEEDLVPIILKQINAGNNIDEIKLKSAKIIRNMLDKKPEIIPSLINQQKIIPIITSALQSKNDDVLSAVLSILDSIVDNAEYEFIAQKFKDFGGSRALRKLLERNVKQQTDTIIGEDIVPIILKQINAATKNDDIKLQSAKIIKNILDKNPQIIPSLINEQKIIPIITRTLLSKNDDLLMIVLSILNSIMDNVEFESIFRKFKNNGGLRALQKLMEHNNGEIRAISNRINSYFDDEHGESNFRGIKPDTSQFDEEVEDEEENEAISPSASARNLRSSKRSAATVTPPQPNPRNKRARRSLDQTDTEHSGSVGDHEEVNYNERILFNDFDDLPSRRSTPIEQQQQRPPIVMFLPPNNNSIEEEDVSTIKGNDNNEIPTNAANNFPPIKCYIPPEFCISKYCEQLGLNFNRKEYVNLWSKYELTQISSTSKPTKFLPMEDKSAFSCFSVFFTGTEQNAELIWGKINGYFGYNLERLGTLDAIVQMFQCRIMVYCNGIWQKYGNWNIPNDDIPLFVLHKKESGNKTNYEIILSLKD